MEKYAHIEKMESIMVAHENMMRQLNEVLDQLAAQQADYTALMEYYYSDQRNQDLEDDSNALIPETMHRGVLSEDEIFDLMGDYRDTALRMAELAIQMLKR